MKTIKVPKERAYYLASPGERHHLLCRIPVQDRDELIHQGRIPPDVLDDDPHGLEVEVSAAGFDKLHLDLSVHPQSLGEAYADLATGGRLPPSGTVARPELERVAREMERRGPVKLMHHLAEGGDWPVEGVLPEPAMTEGNEAMAVMRGQG